MFYKGKHDREKQLRFSIRKVSFGAASVAIAAFMMFIGGGTVQADAIQSNDSSAASVSSNHQQKEYDKKTDNEDRVNTSNLKVSEATSENTESKDVISSTESFNNESRQEEKQFIKADTSKLELAVARVQALLEKTEVNEKTEEVIKSANEELAKAQDLLSNDKVIQGDIDKELSSLNNIDFILKSIPKASIEKKLEKEKENKNQDPRNGKAIPGKGESGFREAVSNSANTISKAIEGPTNNNKLGYGNNPQNGVFESAKEQFGDINFDDAVVKEKKIEKQWSKSILSDKTGKSKTQLLTGGITYKWKEKEINGSLNGWKITDSSGASTILKAIKPEQPVADTGREKEYLGTPSKVYDNDNSITRNYNENEGPNQPLGVHASNQNYANGVNYSGTVGTHNLPKGYYLELGKQGNKISKEYSVNSNSRVILSAITGGAYGNMGTAGTGEKIKISVYDAQNNSLIPSVRDDRTEGEKYETFHISTPTGNGGNGDGWTEYRAIYEIPLNTTRIRVEIEALHDGSALKGDPITGKTSYSLNNGKKQLEDGYFVGAVNLALGTGTEMTTNVKTNNQEGGYGENKLYKSEQKGELEFTVNSVGGIRHYGSAKTEIEIPEGVELPDNIKNAKDTVWFGGVPISPKNIVYDSISRKLTLIYNTSANNAGKDPRIGVGSNNGTRNFKIPFTTTSNYKGTATFKIRTFLPNGLRDSDDNVLLNTGDVSNSNGLYHNTVSGVRNSENPNYYYNKTIYIDSTKPKAPTVETIHTDGVQGNSTNKNQGRNLLISIPEEETGLTDPVREKKDVIENDKNNNNKDNQHKLADDEATTEVEKINHAIGGVTGITVTLPNGAKTIKLTKKGDEWYKDSEKLNIIDGKLVLPLPEDINLDEANDDLSPDKRIKVTVQDKAGNDSDVAYANVLNEAPTLNVNKDVIYVPKTDVSNKVNTEKLLKQVSDTIVDGKPGIEVADLEDDRDNKEITKPNVSVIDDQGLDTSKPGVYTVTLKATDSEGKDSVEKNDDTDKFDVVVVKGIPQIVSVSDNNIQPDVLKNIDKSQFPDDATFEYKEEVNTSEAGDKNVTVVVKDKAGNKLVEVPATVRVVESYPQYVPVNKEGISPKDSIDPSKFPEGTTFEYKEKPNTGSTGDKDVTVVAKLGTEIVAEIPAKIVVVDSKTQYVPVDKSNKQPDASKNIDPEQYPDGVTFKYKTPVDTTTPGEKDVIVEAKDGEDKLVEVPAKVKVVEGKEQLIPVNPTEKPQARDSITPSDYPEGSTFEYKVPDGQTEPFDATTVGDKPVTVVVKDRNGNVLVEVPATIKVVEAKPRPIETPVTNTPLTKDDIAKYVKVPEGGKVTNVENIPDLTTPGKKDPVKVTIELPNGKVITVDVPVNVTPVKEIETPVTTTPLTPDVYTKGITIPEGGKVTKVENIPDLTTQGKKDPVKVTIELPNGKVITVDVPVNVTPVKEIETPVTTTPLTPDDYTKGITIPEGGKVTKVENIPDLTTPGKKDPVKVTVELPNGKVITVDVPVNVTPVKEIETPVTTTPLTPEDYTKGITIPEGGKVTKVENIPDLTTPGKKDPVKVTIELPNGKVITVDVPVTVTPVKEIETPVTTTPLTPEDYTKGITIPEGGKVTKVENIPDLTTPGKKNPVKVTIELPNGKVVTVEVPVNVTPIKEIETPVTNDKLTPEDILKQIKVPEGATVKVGDLPDLTTPGKKDPVKVTITLPNGKVVTVEIPVTVTPIEDIVKKQGDPITTEDVEKHIPKGAKVISIGDKPTTDVPGERPSIPVVIELPNGIRVTVNVPVIVTPKVTPVVVKVGTPVTPEDVQKHIELPNGWKVTKVGEIPTTTTPGTKPVVPVEIELPDGRKITVDVPVIVTPTVRQIVVPQGTPITPDDVKGHIDLPKEPGWEIVEVGEIPTTIPAGVKPSVKVKIKVPTGEIVEVEVPIIVTPKVTPIVVEVGTPITKEDVIKKVGLPEGWEIVEVGEIPTTETPGTKPVVKVKVKLPDGRIITVEVPVTVTPKSQNGDSTIQIVTEYLDENGNRITSDKEGKHNPIELEGYEFSHSTTDAKGNTLHHYKKVTNPINQEQPSSNDKKELPNTGTEDKAGLASLGLLGMLGAFGLVARKKKED